MEKISFFESFNVVENKLDAHKVIRAGGCDSYFDEIPIFELFVEIRNVIIGRLK